MERAFPRRSFKEANIYLIGMMGSGKSTLGRLLAEELKRPFVDTDEWIELRAGSSIAEIFRERGEAHFRDLETASLLEVSQGRGWVVALGGGAVLRAENRRIIRATGYSIYLKIRPETGLARLPSHPERPLLQVADLKERLRLLRQLLLSREPYYLEADFIVENDGPPDEALEKILQALRHLS